MSTEPRVVYATLDSDAPVAVHVRPAWLPIVLVPGFMGSRLSDPRTGKLAWNPLGEPLGDSPGIFTVDTARLQQVASPLTPDETHRYDRRSKHDRWSHVRHWYNLVSDVYAPLVERLERLGAVGRVSERDLLPKIYCCGYDWRQDNARAAARLADVIEEALQETGARKVIVVAHGMGGLVARYYCSAFGGESKVHQLFLVGSPTLGAPSAYAQLRRGFYGIYARDIHRAIKEGDVEEIIEESADAASQVLTLAQTPGTVDLGRAAADAVGLLLLVFSLGAGHYLTRAESRYITRQLPSLYQLLPNGVFCARNRHWILFDPMATGHRPTGFMLLLPSVLDAVLAVVAAARGKEAPATLLMGADRAAAQWSKDLDKAREGGESVEVSGRALRNSMTVRELGDAIGEHVDKGEVGKAAWLLREVLDRCTRAFIDGRSSVALYSDIYTGLLDIVALRPLAAANLALAFQLDAALTVDHRPRAPVTPASLLKELFKDLFIRLEKAVLPAKEALDKQAMRDLEQEELDQHPPLAYMHPRSYSVYGVGVKGDGGAVLVPTSQLSRDDSNVVKVVYLHRPNPFGDSLCDGDGAVPQESAAPPDDWLSKPLVKRRAVAGCAELDLPKHPEVGAFIVEEIARSIEDFPRG